MVCLWAECGDAAAAAAAGALVDGGVVSAMLLYALPTKPSSSSKSNVRSAECCVAATLQTACQLPSTSCFTHRSIAASFPPRVSDVSHSSTRCGHSASHCCPHCIALFGSSPLLIHVVHAAVAASAAAIDPQLTYASTLRPCLAPRSPPLSCCAPRRPSRDVV